MSDLLLRIRSYADELKSVSVWLIERDGAALVCRLSGEMTPDAAEDLAKRLRLATERERSPFKRSKPWLTPLKGAIECVGEFEMNYPATKAADEESWL